MASGLTAPWSRPMRLGELGQGGTKVRLEPDAPQRAAIAKQLDLIGLSALSADLTVRPWLDGVEIVGRFKAVVEQTCSVSLEPFEQPLEGELEVRAVPAGSPQAAVAEGGELELDPEAADPPDVLEGDTIDLAAYVVEHLALEIDPFPRKPGVEFEYTPDPEPESPFAALKALKDRKSRE